MIKDVENEIAPYLESLVKLRDNVKEMTTKAVSY